MKKIALMMAALGLLIGSGAQASVSVSIVASPLSGPGGAPLAGASKTVAVIDRDNDLLAGFGLAGASPDTFLFDADDWIIAGSPDGGASEVWNEATGAFGMNELLYSRTYQFDLAAYGGQEGVDPDDHIFLFWFPGLPVGALTPGPYQAFGVLDLYELDPQNGKLPSNSGTASFSNFGGLSGATADYSTTPEPATLLFVLAGSGLAAIRRRRAS